VKKKIMIALWILIALAIIGLFIFIYLGHLSRSGSPIGLVDGKLAACSTRPNCVSSEDRTDTDHYIEPLVLNNTPPENIMKNMESAVMELGGEILKVDLPYLSATFKSKYFGFVDDLEVRVDGDVVQVRSSSRVGYSDRGVNKKRVEELRRRLE
jgi:uncharacterized protein (DUF1499 family)